MGTNTPLNEREFQLAHETAEWRLIAVLLECPSDSWRTQVRALAKEVGDPELKAAAESAQQEADEGLFHYTFGPGGPAPAREATYHLTVELGYLMSELQSFYNAFAFHPRTEEAPDHVAVETGFVAYLKLKELYALRCGDQGRATTAAEAVKLFITDHLSNVAEPLCGRLRDSGIDYLSRAASALAIRVGPPARAPSPLPILQGTDAEEEFGCGTASHEVGKSQSRTEIQV